MTLFYKIFESRFLMSRFLYALMLLSLFWTNGCSSPRPSVPVSGDSSWLETSAAPTPQPYILGPGNILDIISAKWQDLNIEVQVDSTGAIQYPYLGRIHIQGMTISQLTAHLTEKLQDYYKTPQLTINLLKERERYAYILGEVSRPGPIPLTGNTTLIDAIGLAGGGTEDAAMTDVAFLRPTETTTLAAILDLTTFTSQDGKSIMTARLQEKDIIYIPTQTISDIESFFIRIGNIVRPLLDIERTVLLVPDLDDILTNDKDDASSRTIVISP